jgi:hypothetical protein
MRNISLFSALIACLACCGNGTAGSPMKDEVLVALRGDAVQGFILKSNATGTWLLPEEKVERKETFQQRWKDQKGGSTISTRILCAESADHALRSVRAFNRDVAEPLKKGTKSGQPIPGCETWHGTSTIILAWNRFVILVHEDSPDAEREEPVSQTIVSVLRSRHPKGEGCEPGMVKLRPTDLPGLVLDREDNWSLPLSTGFVRTEHSVLTQVWRDGDEREWTTRTLRVADLVDLPKNVHPSPESLIEAAQNLDGITPKDLPGEAPDKHQSWKAWTSKDGKTMTAVNSGYIFSVTYAGDGDVDAKTLEQFARKVALAIVEGKTVTKATD